MSEKKDSISTSYFSSLIPHPSSLALLGRLIVGGLFIYAGYIKLIEPLESFAAVLENYKILPVSWTIPLAYILPWVEYILGGFLLVGYFTRWAAAGSGVVLLSFLAAISAAYIKGADLSHCGCFGKSGPSMTGKQEFVLDLFLLAYTVMIFKSKEKKFSLDSWIKAKAN